MSDSLFRHFQADEAKCFKNKKTKTNKQTNKKAKKVEERNLKETFIERISF